MPAPSVVETFNVVVRACETDAENRAALPQNWSFDRDDLRAYLRRVKTFFAERDKLLIALNWSLHITVEQIGAEMRGARCCFRFLLLVLIGMLVEFPSHCSIHHINRISDIDSSD